MAKAADILTLQLAASRADCILPLLPARSRTVCTYEAEDTWIVIVVEEERPF